MACFTQKKRKSSSKIEQNEELEVVKLRYLEKQLNKYPIRAFFDETNEQSVLQLDYSDYTWLRVEYKEVEQAVKTNDQELFNQEIQKNKEIQQDQRNLLMAQLDTKKKQEQQINNLNQEKKELEQKIEYIKKEYYQTAIKNEAIKQEIKSQQGKFEDQVNQLLNRIQEANLYY